MKNFWIAIRLTFVMCILLGLGYALILRGIAVVAGPNAGAAELVMANGRIVGAANIGQTFTDKGSFWSRPSAVDYNGGASGGSNKAMTNPEYLAQVEARIVAFLAAHPYLTRADVPSEMVTASGSGLDPDISPRSAEVQAQRIALARGMSEEEVLRIIRSTVQRPWLGLFGTFRVNVLRVNVALDAAQNK